MAPASNQQACPECRSPQQKGKEEIGDICNVQEKVSDGEESTDKEKGVGEWANVDDIRLENIDEAKENDGAEMENDGAEMEIFASGASGDRTGVVACGGLSSSWIIAWQQWICGASFRLIASH